MCWKKSYVWGGMGMNETLEEKGNNGNLGEIQAKAVVWAAAMGPWELVWVTSLYDVHIRGNGQWLLGSCELHSQVFVSLKLSQNFKLRNVIASC